MTNSRRGGHRPAAENVAASRTGRSATVFRNPLIGSCLLLFCLLSLSGMATTAGALASGQPAHFFSLGAAPDASAECSENGFQSPSCMPAEPLTERFPTELAEERSLFRSQDFFPPRSPHRTTVDYPPEFP